MLYDMRYDRTNDVSIFVQPALVTVYKSILSLSNSQHIRWNKIFPSTYLLYLQFSYTTYFFVHYLLSCTVELV